MQNHAFITLLKKRGPTSFEEFVRQLEKHQPHLADKIKECERIIRQLEKYQPHLTNTLKERDGKPCDALCLVEICRVGWKLIKRLGARVQQTIRGLKNHLDD